MENELKAFKFGELDAHLFAQGTHYEIFRKLGAHLSNENGQRGVNFSVWAPNAKSVSVVGDFNGWEPKHNRMEELKHAKGIYEIFIPEVVEYSMYKFYIETKAGEGIYKTDPYGFYHQKRPETASIVYNNKKYKWKDSKWLAKRKKTVLEYEPVSVYEVHPGSWKRHPHSGGNDNNFYTYRELAHTLTEYVIEMGYTHIELMGIMEYPYDGSWGYQVTGYYAPTSRYGEPEDFMYLIDYLHEHNIGVILDWVPAHFPKDSHGLSLFDGSTLYEYENPIQGEHPQWGTKVFDFGKREIRNFLIGSAIFWIEEYHIDGLRVDAVASMLYLDYCREKGQWLPNRFGGNKNLEAEEFLKHLNSVVIGRNKGIVMIAEESTTWPGVTKPPYEGGLGFTFKWNMGWMNDFLEYMKLDPYFRQYNHHKLTFSITYAYSEKYMLVLSHDEVVHLKCSMLSKMPGFPEDKVKNLKAAYVFMLGHPGKKLLFMGQDFGQLTEWSEERELDWYLLDDEAHRGLQTFEMQLMKIYKEYPALYELDNENAGFEWINADDSTRSIYSFIRRGKGKTKSLLFICNFTPMTREDYRVGVPYKGKYELIMNQNGIVTFGKKVFQGEKINCDNREFSFAYALEGYGVGIFKFKREDEEDNGN
jgi:alpha-1,4-glucan:alpha-1,4-glucan 6-glycosyltransferase